MRNIFLASFVCFLSFAALPVLAQGISATDTGLSDTATAAGFDKAGDVQTIIGNVIKVALGFVGFLFFAIILFGGFLWMTAGGGTDQIGKAKKLIGNAVIGLVVIIAAYAITIAVLSAIESGTIST